MNRLTSMADFYARVKQDSRYELVARMAHKESGSMPRNGSNTYEDAVSWIEGWITTRRQDLRLLNKEDTCMEMVNYLNKVMDKIPIFSSKLMSPHTINTFTNQKIDQ